MGGRDRQPAAGLRAELVAGALSSDPARSLASAKELGIDASPAAMAASLLLALAVTLVFVGPEQHRTAFAEEAGTTVLAVGSTIGK